MKILIIGNGGREHALTWKVSQSEQVSKIFVASGNAGTATEKKVENIAIKPTDLPKLLDFAQSEKINLTIVGPEAPLALGIVDFFQKNHLKIFGPTQWPAQLESSKAFSKDFMVKYNIPTAFYKTFTDITAAKKFIEEQGAPIVIKADGLAAGKGVVVAETIEEAKAAVDMMLAGNSFGEAGHRVVIEEFLAGEEASFIVMCDGENALAMATSQDHKRRDDNDQGPNTGGMGAYSPAPIVTEALHQKVMEMVIKPVLEGMKKEGHPYTGFLYAGLMIDKDQNIKVLEFNCRFGDPETQPIMMRLQSDLLELCLIALDKKLETQTAQWDPRSAVGVVMASQGYPDAYPSGDVIEGLNQKFDPDVKIFQAGTTSKEGKTVSNGGRVLCVTALGDTLQKACDKAYQVTKTIHWGNEFYRTDIGNKALEK
jgi:phosphoribosylamine--glycine ligase